MQKVGLIRHTQDQSCVTKYDVVIQDLPLGTIGLVVIVQFSPELKVINLFLDDYQGGNDNVYHTSRYEGLPCILSLLELYGYDATFNDPLEQLKAEQEDDAKYACISCDDAPDYE
jgi:hypothetical protein